MLRIRCSLGDDKTLHYILNMHLLAIIANNSVIRSTRMIDWLIFIVFFKQKDIRFRFNIGC